MSLRVPNVEICCGCVRDLRTAAAIIAVLGIVTSPVVSWSIVRHTYVIRVSCFVSTTADRPDIVDINLHNVLSFGFGGNAGLGPSCLDPKANVTSSQHQTKKEQFFSGFVIAVKYFGWLVMIGDIVFLFASINFLFKIFKGSVFAAAKYFIFSCCVTMVLSFVYGMLFVTACISIGGKFPIFEFAFSVIDILIWAYFLIVVYSYIRRTVPLPGVTSHSS